MRFSSLHVLYSPRLPDLLFLVKIVRIIFEFLRYWFIIGDFTPTGDSWPKISGRRGRLPPTILLLRKL